MWKRLRNVFITGLMVLFPIAATIYFVAVLFRFADGILGPLVSRLLRRSIPGLGFILTVLMIFVTGVLARNIIGRRLIQMGENLLMKMPFVRGIYSTLKQVMDAFVSQDKRAFKQVVLVEWPRKGVYSIGFITGESRGEIWDRAGEDLVHVLVVTTPNPTTGFLTLIPKKEVIFLDMSVEDGMKVVISGGMLLPEAHRSMKSYPPHLH